VLICAAAYLVFHRGGKVSVEPVPARGETNIDNQNDMNHIRENDIQSSGMQILSPLFGHNGNFPANNTCDGKEINPPLVIAGVSKEAKSLALILRDPDAPSGQFYHWVVWNIDPKTEAIPADSVPEGAIQGVTSSRHNFYIGPCPPSGTHRYYFDLYALDAKLNLPEATTAPQLKAAMEGHIIEQAELMARYR